MFYWKIEFKWALIFSILSIMWMVLEKILGLHNEYLLYQPYFTSLSLIPLCVIFVLALKERNVKDFEGEVSFRNAFISLFKLSFLITILSPIFYFFIFKYITPNYVKNLIFLSVEKGSYSSSVEAKASINTQMLLVINALKTFGFGLGLSFLISFFVSKKAKV